ncbi:MAG: hypothetical protein JRJ85_00495 [Deltaproteobacteria bacterium]|nr:hypothetical protein [Deltaproteobacteria bacterium]
MSYILEALRKMERQRRKDDDAEAWVNELAAEPDEKSTFSKNPSRLLVAASIVFGASGILAGLIFYQDNSSADREKGQMNPSPVITDARKPPSRVGPQIAKPTLPAEDKEAPSEPESTASQGTTISQIKSTMASSEGAVEKRTPTRGMNVSAAAPIPRPQQKPVDIIDLTDRYRLTSTGAVDKRKYATIDRQDYFKGDIFKGMLIVDIKKDRVYLMGEKSKQRYVIVFRYRE